MNLQEKYKKEVIPAMKAKFGLAQSLAVPRIKKIVINSGIGRIVKEEKVIESMEADLVKITGQKVVKTKARKSIASFKLRQGTAIGIKVTMRKKRMYDFLNRLINVALPRTHDFRGLSLKSVDKNGNLTIGIKEHIVFPEAVSDQAKNIFGFEITIVTEARNREEAIEFYKLIGFPIKKTITK